MRDVVVHSADEAIEGIQDGSAILMGGFGGAGLPRELIRAVLRSGVKNLTVISNNAGADADDLSLWFAGGIITKMICSYPRSAAAFAEQYRAGKVELELVPQGTLIERIRCGGAGLGGVLSPVGVGTVFERDKEKVVVDGRTYLLEKPIRADWAMLKGHKADTLGNVVYNKTARNYSPVMATAAALTVVEVDEIVRPGALDPEAVVTPCIFVNRVFRREAA